MPALVVLQQGLAFLCVCIAIAASIGIPVMGRLVEGEGRPPVLESCGWLKSGAFQRRSDCDGHSLLGRGRSEHR